MSNIGLGTFNTTMPLTCFCFIVLLNTGPFENSFFGGKVKTERGQNEKKGGTKTMLNKPILHIL